MDYNNTKNYLDLVDLLAGDLNNLPDNISSSFLGYVKFIYRSDLEDRYSNPMLWIGMYIALASLCCILAMGADLLHGLRSRKLWFPCKYFSINSFSLAVIAVAMKLPVDLSGSMPGEVDQVAKLGSMAFMCTMMANLLPCLATMDNNQLLTNITALGVFVITLVVNMCIQINTGVVSYKEDAKFLEDINKDKFDLKSLGINKYRNTIIAIIYVTLLMVLLIMHVCSSFAILKSKEIIESKYQQGHKKASKEVQQSTKKFLTVDELERHVCNYWIMAGSGSPQFIVACFATTTASGVICASITILHTLTVSWTISPVLQKDYDSSYKWSNLVILIVQFVGVVIGTIAPLSRCFTTLSFKESSNKILDHIKVFKVERYWTQKLLDWKHGNTRFTFLKREPNHVIKTFKTLILNSCIEFQEGVVVVCKLITLIPFFFMICIWSCLRCLKWFFQVVQSSSGEDTENMRESQYVLHLENGTELVEKTLKGLLKSMNRLIQKGLKKQLQCKNLVEKSTIQFVGVKKFDNGRDVPPTPLNVEYQDCWSLPVVTLTTIAATLPDIEITKVNSLWESVRKGLQYVTLVEKCLNATDDYVSIQNAAETLWEEVYVYRKWLGKTFQDIASQVSTPDSQVNTPVSQVNTPASQVSTPASQVNTPASQVNTPAHQVNTPASQVSTPDSQVNTPASQVNAPASQVNTPASDGDITRKIVQIFFSEAKKKINTSGTDSKCTSICAYSMYRVAKTILDDMESQKKQSVELSPTHKTNQDDKKSQETLFDELSAMIADIMAACLTNLPQVIAMKCHTSVIEEREGCVLDAVCLLGETKEMIEVLQSRDIQNLDRDDLPFIDKWRVCLGEP